MSEDNPHRHLIDGYCSGALSDAEFAELEEVLRQDPELRRELIESRMLESDLRDYASAQKGEVFQPELRGRRIGTLRLLTIEWVALAAVALIFMIGVIGVLVQSRWENPVRVDRGVAVLARSLDADWSQGPLRQGDSMAPGHWSLEEGQVELAFYSGATVILEAPAELEIIAEDEGRLLAGKLRADVPVHAQGFTITTPEIELVDLGTSFGIAVESTGVTAVHVFQGKVELFRSEEGRAAGTGQYLVGGEGQRMDPSGEVAAIAADEDLFLSPAEFDRLSQVRMEQEVQRWQETRDTIQQLPDLIVYYDFEPASPSSRSLFNRAGSDLESLHGSVIGATWVEGRWPGKGALEFRRPADRVRIDVPITMQSMTLAAWVRIDALEQRFTSLMLSDSWGREGDVHWQFRKDFSLDLSVWYGKKKRTYDSKAPLFLKPSDYGRWMMLAAVYDGDTGTVTQYRDGEVIGTSQVDATIPLVIGSAEIGNWTPSPRKERQIRHFNGRMDEFMIFGRVLGAAEIVELYESGKP